ncbi:MAG: hypothetical protein GC180_01770 [Bacteroidetes bacterium]|nr:hypothetical protein [Bacteroidota bacterium]
MKKITSLSNLAMILAIAFVSCQKNTDTTPTPNGTVSTLNSTEQSVETPEGFSDQIPQAFENMEVLGGTETEDFYMENDGIPAFLDEEPFADDAMQGKRGYPCALRDSLELSKEQKAKIHRAWQDYIQCRHVSIEKLHHNYKELRARYEKKHAELVQALRNQHITPQQFRESIQKLRHAFHADMMRMNRTYHDVIRHCYKEFLTKMSHIMRPAQFRFFMHCHAQRFIPRR